MGRAGGRRRHSYGEAMGRAGGRRGHHEHLHWRGGHLISSEELPGKGRVIFKLLHIFDFSAGNTDNVRGFLMPC